MASNWAIVIGINQYRFLQPLKYAKRDAEAMNGFLTEEAKFDRIFLFTDDSPPISGKPTEPFRANLLRVLRQIFALPFMKDGDNFWFFFSGHGIPHNGQDYLMPLDGDPEDIENTGISTNTITNYLRSCGADNAVMILDACRSGGKKSGEGIGRQTEAEARQTGVISLFSCSPDQYSYELEAIEQGAFTYALLEGLGIRGRCATLERLNQYLEHRVPEIVSQYLQRVRQTPYTIVEPLNRSHLILMPQHASLSDIATLKNDAYRAQMKQDWNLTQQLWIRVLAAASGQDMEAIEALQKIAVGKASGTPIQQTPLQLFLRLWMGTVGKASGTPIQQTLQPNLLPHTITAPTQPQTLSLNTPTQQPRARIVGDKLPDNSKSPIPLASPHSPPPTLQDDLSSERFGADYYTKLRDLLKARDWKAANQETADRICDVVERDKEDWLWVEDVQNFPCQDLRVIDQLWVKYSQGKFGFSVQKRIYVGCGAKLDGNYPGDDIWKAFSDRVGWRENGKWLNYSDLNPSFSSPQGNFPCCWIWGWGGDAGWVVWWFVGSGVGFFPRIVTCKL